MLTRSTPALSTADQLGHFSQPTVLIPRESVLVTTEERILKGSDLGKMLLDNKTEDESTSGQQPITKE